MSLSLGKVRSVARTMRAVGPRAYARYLWDRALEAYYERWLGMATGGIIQLREVGVEASVGNEYGPTSYSVLYMILDRCQTRPDDVFLDMGCGKGRALIIAGRYPLRRIIGVDVSAVLADVARDNVQRLRRKLRCRNIESVVADATAYDVPDDVTIVYFNYSFDGETFERFLDRVRLSLVRVPRTLTLVCNLPIIPDIAIEAIIEKHEWLVKTEELRVSAWAPTRRCLFYTSRVVATARA